MYKLKELKDKDWYEVLNQNVKYVNINSDFLNKRTKQIFGEQLKLKNMGLLNSKSETKLKENNETKKISTEAGFEQERKNQSILNRLNLKNYKDKNILTSSSEALYMIDILSKLDKINKQRISIFSKSKRSNFESNIFNKKTFFNKSRNISNSNMSYKKKEDKKILRKNYSKDSKLSLIQGNKNYLIFKPYNNIQKSSNNNNDDNNNNGDLYFPIIKDKKDKNIYSNSVFKYKYNLRNKNKNNIVKIVKTEEDKTMHKSKSLYYNILKLNKDFNKMKQLINGNRKEEKEEKNGDEYIMINNKKVYQLNLKKELNKNYTDNFLKIKGIKDIEENILNYNNTLFDSMKKNLMMKYFEKNKIFNFRTNNTNYIIKNKENVHENDNNNNDNIENIEIENNNTEDKEKVDKNEI